MKCLTLTLAALTLSACGATDSKETAKAEAALSACRKIQAATQVGVTPGQYGDLLIDAKAKVNELKAGPVKDELGGAVDTYADAGALWSEYVREGRFVPADIGVGQQLVQRYGLPTDCCAPFKYVVWEGALGKIWAEAGARVERAASLVEK